MASYQPIINFSAQSYNVQAVFHLYEQFGSASSKAIGFPKLAPLVVMLAFAVESYLNSIGSRNIPIWEDIERLPWRTKVAILHKTKSAPIDWGRDPLQFASDIFAIRDKLAHGRSERVEGPVSDYETALRAIQADSIQPAWLSKVTMEWVLQSKPRFRNLMIYLGNLYQLPEGDHLLNSSGYMEKYEGHPPT